MSLQGNLSTLGIAEILELLGSRGSTGQLDIETPFGSARFMLFRGELAGSTYEFGNETGHDAAYSAYLTNLAAEGTFLFDEDQVPQLGTPTEAISTVLERSNGIGQAWEEILTQISSTAHIVRRYSNIDATVSIEPSWWPILDVVGSGKSVIEIAAESGQDLLSVAKAAADMVSATVLTVDEPEAASIGGDERSTNAQPDETDVGISDDAVAVDPPGFADDVDLEERSLGVSDDSMSYDPGDLDGLREGVLSPEPNAEAHPQQGDAAPLDQGVFADLQEVPTAGISDGGAPPAYDPVELVSQRAGGLRSLHPDRLGGGAAEQVDEPDFTPVPQEPMEEPMSVLVGDYEPLDTQPDANPDSMRPKGNDPFNELSDLVPDEEEDQERGSVLKFLRRD